MPGYNHPEPAVPSDLEAIYNRARAQQDAFIGQAGLMLGRHDGLSDRLDALTVEVRRLAEVVASKDGYTQRGSGLWVPAGKGYTEAEEQGLSLKAARAGQLSLLVPP